MGLEKIRGLPPVPSHVKLFEAGRGYRIAEIHWEINLEEEQLASAIYFVVESRHHIGMSFAERKLENDWQNHTPTAIFELKRAGSQKRYVGEMKLKPGRWYQVRVAAVNELGTRGYSVVSREFQLSKKPNPPQSPKNLTLGPLVPNANGTYNRKVTWQLPRSDLPVDKYKISWSLYLNASKAGNSSLFKETATVSAVRPSTRSVSDVLTFVVFSIPACAPLRDSRTAPKQYLLPADTCHQRVRQEAPEIGCRKRPYEHVHR